MMRFQHRRERLTNEGYMAGKAGQPCESPTRELDQAVWETGYREGKKEYDKAAKDARDKAECRDMEEFNEPKPANLPPALTTEPMLFDSLATEVDSGPLSVLSDSAKDRIKAMIHMAMEDGYNRGYKACECDWHIADSNRMTRFGDSDSGKGRLTMATTGGASPK